MTQIAASPVEEVSIAELLEFFRESYGASFVGFEHFTTNYLEKVEKVVCIGEIPNLSAVALLRLARITAVATNPNREVYGSRQGNLVGLFGVIHEFEPDTWVTIGENAVNVQICASRAGMRILNNTERLKSRVEKFDGINASIVLDTSRGLAVATVDSIHGPNYTQHAWGWED